LTQLGPFISGPHFLVIHAQWLSQELPLSDPASELPDLWLLDRSYCNA